MASTLNQQSPPGARRIGPKYRRRRFQVSLGKIWRIVTIAFVLGLILGLAVAGWPGSKDSGSMAMAGSQSSRPQGELVLVESGDTLWALAREHGGADVDPRRAVFELRQNNDIKDCIIQPGQTLELPAHW